LTVYVVASAVCALAPDPAVLIGMRLVQGLAGAAGIVIARAVVRDLYDGLAAARLLSSLMLVSGTAPILAPVLGAQLLRLTSWRGVFVTLTLLGLAILAATATLLTETLPTTHRRHGGLTTTLRTMRDLLRDRRFTGYLLTGSLGFAALFAYIAGSSFTLQRIYGASPQTYSLLFALNSIGMVTTGQLNGKLLLGRFPSHRVLATGLAVLGAASTALLLLVTTTHAGLPWIATALFFNNGCLLPFPEPGGRRRDAVLGRGDAAKALEGNAQREGARVLEPGLAEGTSTGTIRYPLAWSFWRQRVLGQSARTAPGPHDS
jgi:DHA1 family bicyclomycin/chloramphenicol resistance-like MFS transporter